MRSLICYALSVASLAIPAALALVLQSHGLFRPIVGLSYLVTICAVAWWGGALPGILVSFLTIFLATFVTTHGKTMVPHKIDPVGLIAWLLIVILISRIAKSRKRVEEVLRNANEELEVKVRSRTADLSKSAASLEAEVLKHQQTEGQLRHSEQRYRLLFEDSPLAMAVLDTGTLAFLAVNATAENLYGYTREELLQMTLPDTWPSKEAPPVKEGLDANHSDYAYTGEFITQRKDGKLLNLEVKIRSIDFGGRKAQLALLTDVTENKRLESLLRQSQKMEAIGNLAGGIAHDFNNLLTVILGYSDSILHKLGDTDPLREKITEIHAAGKRAANLTSQLLAFSRKQILKPQILELNHVVSNISRMLGRLVGEDIRISLRLDADLGQIQADPGQLEQVLVNLAVNARDAMPTGGQFVIETHNIHLDDHAAVLEGVQPGSYVVLIVSDTGCGMDEQTKSRVFEPFFTTKEVGKGTGLGLSMVFGVVKQSGGTVTIYSEVGIGTTFKIYLPRTDKPAVQDEEIKEPSYTPSVGNGATILLVEDEPSLRRLALAVLQEGGYHVVEASNGKEALQIAEHLASEPALLLTDVVMPEMSGMTLAEELHHKWPGLVVLYTSGYTDHALLQRNALRQDMPFLQKPYMPGSLLEQVAAVLETKPRPVVLVVDDEPQIRDLLRSAFEENGYRVLEAQNGRQAMAQIHSEPVKLIVTDLAMPVADGIEMLQELRRIRYDAKIIAISGVVGDSCLGAAAKLGADSILRKPFEREQVIELAKTLVSA